MISPADVSKINEVTQAFLKAALARDWAALAALYVEDAVFHPPNMPGVKGRAAIRGWFENFPPLTSFKATNVTVDGQGDFAYVVGTYTTTMAPPGAPGPVNDKGKFVEVRRKQPDGRWLIAVDMFSSDLPAPAPAA
jgi:uncharacterized protein (TIGR02246 family)